MPFKVSVSMSFMDVPLYAQNAKRKRELLCFRFVPSKNFLLVREAGVEPTTFGSGGRRSIQLSYSRKSGANLSQCIRRGKPINQPKLTL